MRPHLAACVTLAIGPLAAQGGDARLQLAERGRDRPHFSGVYPHLASFNRQAECGTGAVVHWADRLWWVTYAPHRPRGSDDKLYAMNADRDLFVFADSIGGTPANRMIHRESRQLLIGPYVIDERGKVRVIPSDAMPGRLTGTARHLQAPASKVYYATMEEGVYAVDVRTLAVEELFPDGHKADKPKGFDLLPGYHGKGLYSGQDRLVYSNNGENSPEARQRPDIPSGVLAEWRGGKDAWRVVLRNQFTEVTGPGGIEGNPDRRDPIWSIGWDPRSVLLMLLDGGAWQRFRLPKASHCYDGAHGWNTEWPRIRTIGEDGSLLMTMHGTFWRFPLGFRAGATAGITPRSTYLKVVGDFCRYGEHVVLACDDAARSEFLNKRRAKGEVAAAAESQSNLWFVAPDRLDRLGPAVGRGAVWLDDQVQAGQPSDPFLFAGYARRAVHLRHDARRPVRFRFEVDDGDGKWRLLRTVTVPAEGYAWHPFKPIDPGAWIRVTTDRAGRATAWFEYRAADLRPHTTALDDAKNEHRAAPFAGLATARAAAEGPVPGALLRAGDRDTGLQVLATRVGTSGSEPAGYYELSPGMQLARVEAPEKRRFMVKKAALAEGVLSRDGDSILYVDDDGQRFRLPVGNPVYTRRPALLARQRIAREVVTERDLMQCAGTIFELPARNAGGFAKVRPIATHPLFVQDFCSWRGLMVLSGVSAEAEGEHVVRSKDGNCAVWLGTIDDLWSLGKPIGTGGPWTRTPVRAWQKSDPYLMAGYDRKTLYFRHDALRPVLLRIEVDITGTGAWCVYLTINTSPTRVRRFDFPAGFEAYWVRFATSVDCTATVRLDYR